jgi:hypothetical protein
MIFLVPLLALWFGMLYVTISHGLNNFYNYIIKLLGYTTYIHNHYIYLMSIMRTN